MPRAVVVRDRLGGLEVEDQRALGSPDLPAPPGADCRPRGTWVVNRTTRNLRVLEVEYGDGLGLPPTAPLVIPPATACSTHELDYIGPRDKPPTGVRLQGDEARLHTRFRTWLTWD